MSIDRLQANYPLRIRWVHFPLHPDTPDSGLRLTELFPGRDLAPMQARLRQLMEEAGLPYGVRSHTYNSRLAQELGKWADTQPGGAAIHDRLFHAYFAEGLNIADPQVLVEVATASGLDAETAAQVVETRRFRQAVDDDWQYSHQVGVTGVPTFHARGLVVVGCQPYELLERFVLHLGELAEQAETGS